MHEAAKGKHVHLHRPTILSSEEREKLHHSLLFVELQTYSKVYFPFRITRMFNFDSTESPECVFLLLTHW